MDLLSFTRRGITRLAALTLLSLGAMAPAWAGLTVTPLTWNVIGLDSNNPTNPTLPNQFPVGARVCAVGTASNGPVTASFQFETFIPHPPVINGDTACAGGTPCVTVRSGTLASYSVGSIAAGTCADAYFEVEVKREAAAFGTGRLFTVRATDSNGTVSSPQPRELYVERLISQNRNSILNVFYSNALNVNDTFPTPQGSMTSVAAGGSFALSVGGIYDIRLNAQTAPGGYEQLQTFANFSNAVFRILRVESQFSANTSPSIGLNPNPGLQYATDRLYADACSWQLSPILPNYLGCTGTGKTGGLISSIYRIQILAVPSGGSSALNTLIYDYSGASYHYNADNSSGGRTIIIESATSAVLSKSFGPASIAAGGTSTLVLTITNNNLSTVVTNPSFTDDLSGNPIGLTTDPTTSPTIGYTGCGGGTLTVSNSGTLLSYSGGSIQPQSSCVITVPVRATTAGSYLNQTSILTIGATPTTSFGSATLTVGAPSQPSSCISGQSMATWSFSTGAGTVTDGPIAPSASPGVLPGTQAIFNPLTPGSPSGQSAIVAAGNPGGSWQGVGWPTTAATSATTSNFEFTLNFAGYRDLAISFDNFLPPGDWGNTGNDPIYAFYKYDNEASFSSVPGFPTLIAKNSWIPLSGVAASTGNPTSIQFRIMAGIRPANKPNASLAIDNVVVTGCRVVSHPTLEKSFAADPIFVGQTSVLSFTITNTSTTALTGAAFTDSLPTGLVVDASVTPTYTGCGTGAFTGFVDGATLITFANGQVAAGNGQTCVATIGVRGTTAGLKTNITSPIFTNETQTSPLPTGFGEDTILVLQEAFRKSFQPVAILTGGISRLTLAVSNSSLTDTMTSVSFSDTFPPDVELAVTPNLTISPASCAVGASFGTIGNNQVALANGTVAPGQTCLYSVDVTSASANTYLNTTTALVFRLNGAGDPITADTASATLVVTAPTPRIALQKRISTTDVGPWGEFVAVALNDDVYYQFTVENTGDVTLTRPGTGFWITDALVSASPMCPGTATLAPGDFFECVVGPVEATAETLLNEATASGVSGGTVTDNDTASYTTLLPDLSVLKVRSAPTLAAVPLGNIDTSTSVAVSYTITVTNLNQPATVNDTLAPIVVEDTLQSGVSFVGFSAANPFWSCVLVQTAPDRVSCTFSGELAVGASTSFDLHVSVAAGTTPLSNTATTIGGGDPKCVPNNPNPLSPCIDAWVETTVPVTLSDVSVQVDGGQLVVEFGTAIEAGTLGFNVLGSRAGERTRTPLSDGLVMASGASLEPQRYEVRAPYTGQAQVWIEELTTSGGKKAFGPYAVGSQTGERDLFVATDWSAIADEQAAFRQAQASALISRSSGGSIEAELRVSTTGLARVTHENLLAAGIDWTGVPSREIRLAQGSDSVPMRYEGPENFGPGSVVSFLAEAISDSLYTKTAVYRLSVSTQGASYLRTVYSGIGRNVAATTVGDRLVHNPPRGYDLSSAHTDPWHARRLVRANNAPVAGVNEVFVVTDRAATSQNERIEVGMWGGLTSPVSPDHSVRLLLNGTEIARPRFDGLTYHQVAIDLPAGLLVNGQNTLRMELIGDTGASADVVYLDDIQVSYTRELKAINDRLAFVAPDRGAPVRPEQSDRIHADDFSTEGVAACASSNPNCASYRISGLTRSDVNVFRADALGNIEQLTGVRTTAVAGGFELAFSTLQFTGDRYWIEPDAGSATAAIAPKAPVTDPLAGGSAEYLIISHPSFINGLAPLVAARLAEGLSVRVVDVENIYDYYNRGTMDPAAIAAATADAFTRLGTRYVLLVGGDTWDYFNYLGANSRSFVPTFYGATGPIVRYSPVDSVYADVDADGRSDIAIGRFPVRTMAELDATIAKTLAYGSATHAGKLLTVADRTDQESFSYRTQLAGLRDLLGDDTVRTDLAMDNYAPGNAGLQLVRSDLASAVNSGQALVTFFGHSGPSNWSNESLLTASLVHGGIFNNASVPTVAWVLGCYGSFFTSPSYNAIGPALMVQANGGGAAAVLGTTGLTNINSDLAWMTALKPYLGTMRIGDAMLEAQRSLVDSGAEYYDVSFGGVLLGDPALRVRE